MSPKQELPLESNEQRIGQLAKRALTAAMPTSWRETPLDGDSDAGLDYNVQIVHPTSRDGEGQYKEIFRLQLKGTESPKLSADGSYFSIDLSGSTVRYYERITEPILLVLCDMSVAPDRPAECPAYCEWIHELIQQRRRDNPSAIDEQASITFRIRRANVLTPAFDASPEIQRNRGLMKVALQLDHAVERGMPSIPVEERGIYAGKVIGGFEGRPSALLEAMAKPATSMWPQASASSFAGRLNRVEQHLRGGNIREADSGLKDALSQFNQATNLEQAEYLFLQARVLSLGSNESESIRCYENAYRLSGSPKHLTAWIESALREQIKSGGTPDYKHLRDQLVGEDAEIVALRARVFATERNFDAADAELGRLDETEVRTTRAICALIADDWSRVTQICDVGLKDADVSLDQRCLLHFLLARAYFNLAVGTKADDPDSESLSSWMSARVDIQLLKKCWDEIQTTVSLLNELGWPENTDLLADIWAATSIYLGQSSQTLPVLISAAQARPGMRGLQRAVVSVAMDCERPEDALDANERLGDGPDETLFRIALLYQAKKYTECLRVADERLEGISPDHVQYPLGLSFAVLAADKVIKPDRAKYFQSLLEAHPRKDEFLASLDYARTVKKKGLPGAEAIAELGRSYESHPSSFGLGLQYLLALRVEEEADAVKAIELSLKLQKTIQLPSEGELHLAQAYVTVADWTALLNLAERGLERFSQQTRFAAIQAFSLDKLGRTAEARRLLEALSADDLDDELAINTYIRIAARTGFTETAIGLVEQMVASANTPRRKLGYLKLLYDLVASESPVSERTEGIAWAIGQVANQEDEKEEGLFLALYLTACNGPDVALNTQKAEEFTRRADRFHDRFPTSTIFRRFTMPENPSLADFEAMVAQIDPGYRERSEHRAEMERLLQRGATPFPYVWRPQWVLQNIPDVQTLWQIAKISAPSDIRFHLTMQFADWQVADPTKVLDRVPLLDFPALLVLNDLDLFPVLFQLFGRVAVSQATFESLRAQTSPFSSGWGRQKSVEIANALRANLDNIISPSTPATDHQQESSQKLISDEIKTLVSTGEFMLFSDDAVFAIFADVAASGVPRICTMDLLCIADEKGLLQPEQVSAAIGKLCAWHVALAIPDRYIFASIPERVLNATTVDEAIEVLRTDPVSGPIFGGIWSIQKPYADLAALGARHASRWIQDEGNRIETVTSLIGLWLLKAKFHKALGNLTPVDQLGLMLIIASASVDRASPAISSRFWSIYLRLVEWVHGPQMDEKKEIDAIEAMGRHVAGVDVEVARTRRDDHKIKPFWASGLTAGTAPEEHFLRGYNDEWTKRMIEADKASRSKDEKDLGRRPSR